MSPTKQPSKAKKQIVDEIFKPIRRKFNRRRTIIKGLFDLWQADLAQMDNYAKMNRGYKFILVVINCFSKFLYARPLKTKSAQEVTSAMESILKENHSPKNLQTDQG